MQLRLKVTLDLALDIGTTVMYHKAGYQKALYKTTSQRCGVGKARDFEKCEVPIFATLISPLSQTITNHKVVIIIENIPELGQMTLINSGLLVRKRTIIGGKTLV